jgi:hypothetical protein
MKPLTLFVTAVVLVLSVPVEAKGPLDFVLESLEKLASGQGGCPPGHDGTESNGGKEKHRPIKPKRPDDDWKKPRKPEEKPDVKPPPGPDEVQPQKPSRPEPPKPDPGKPKPVTPKPPDPDRKPEIKPSPAKPERPEPVPQKS